MSSNKKEDELEWDFKWGDDPTNLSLVAIPTELGTTYVEDLSEANVDRVQMWAKMQLEAVLSDRYKQIKMKKREATATPKTTTKEDVIFGTPLTVLLERDQKHYPDPRRDRCVPLVLEVMLLYFTLKGGMSLGPSVLNDPNSSSAPSVGQASSKDGGHRPPVLTERNVILTLDRYFHKAAKYSHIALNMAKISDIVFAIKHFITNLPEPLLTNQFIDVFLQLHHVKDSMDILIIMKLLILQLPKIHRCTLWCLLTFFGQLSSKEEKDTLVVVREIMAPYLFPVSEAMKKEMPEGNPETLTRLLTFLMHRYRNILFTVPADVVKALRTYDKKKAGNADNVTVTVNSLQLGIHQLKIDHDPKLKAREVVKIAVSTVKEKHSPPDVESGQKHTSKEEKTKPLAQVTWQFKENAKDSQCNVTSADLDFFADCHRLYEVGGNIDERRLSHDAVPVAVYRENPDVKWEIHCEHPVCASEFASHVPDYEKMIGDESVAHQLTNLCRMPAFDAQS